MSAISRRISAGAGISSPEIRRINREFRQSVTVNYPRNSSTLISDKNQRLGLVYSVKRWIEVRSDGVDEWKGKKRRNRTTSLKCRVSEVDEKETKDRKVEVMVAAGATVVFGVGNRVLYKLALVPLKHYPFFLAQLATFGYVVVYFSILYMRHRAGIVTKEMLSLPQVPFLAVGLVEALAAASGMAAATMLSGASIPILSQTFLVWQLLLSMLFLGRRYNFNQLAGCLLVSMGVIITVASGSGAGPSLNDTGIFWSFLMIFSFFLQAADTILKEVIFLNAAERLKVYMLLG